MNKSRFLIFLLAFIVIGVILLQSKAKDKTKGLAYSVSIPTLTPTATTAPVTPTPTVSVPITKAPTPTSPTPTLITTKKESTIQIVKATYGPPFGFTPEEFKVKVGKPVRLEVYATENGRGCMGSIMIPDLAPVIQGFAKGQTNIFEFTPTIPGEYPITCAMGIPHGFIIVE